MCFTTFCAAQRPDEFYTSDQWEISKGFDAHGNLVVYENSFTSVKVSDKEKEHRQMMEAFFEGIPENFDPMSTEMHNFMRQLPYYGQAYTYDSDSPKHYSPPTTMEEMESSLEKYLRNASQTDMEELTREFRELYEEYQRYLQRRADSH